MGSSSPLFRPLELPGLTLPNRIVMAPMTREASPGGVPGPDVADYYARRAAGGVGLIITEATDIDHPASWGGRPGVPRFYGDDALAGWAHVVDAVHGAGGRIVPQLWHIGAERAVAGDLDPGTLISPSGLATTGERIGEPMTEAQIADVVASFARAAADARRLGFDGVEIQAGHGFLIDQFFWDGTNKRDDGYGGDFVQRTRFATEVVAAVRAATAPDFTVLMRLSQWKVADFTARLVTGPEELDRFLAPLVTAGVDVFHCSTRRYWQPEFEGSELNLAGWIKKLTGKPTMTVGNIGLADGDFMTTFYAERKGSLNAPVEPLEEMLERGEADLAVVGRVLLADSQWPEKIRTGSADLVPFRVEMAELLN
ncbi:NADH:flavin oxidoreductase [Streptomyces prunicolor]|uniref:NADH:flavin oxidoreductase n=1 Tax=Streptomyces prunicolor TaxID=67348 RepID=A0ABU4FRL3_9ACTN|nr:NADH:flavin oxidoreductase [Streptomyces prunicolor]MCX5236662.1 NADH:flavin oxidoreductase [Streptomyces prunicolor]MDV7223258.1 NADH:flavin oxidoreductase [Streptomyces prunicolor]